MAIRIKMWKKVSAWFLLVAFSFVVALAEAETDGAPFEYAHSLSGEPAQIEAPQDFHYSSHIILKIKYADWMGAQIVHDVPDIVLRNSLTNWTTDYLRNPFYRLTNINAP